MERDELVAYCLGKPGARPHPEARPERARGEGDGVLQPWGEDELVAKVGGKGFAFIGPGTVSVKCGRDASEAAEWRDRYPDAITKSHYVGRYGWNSVDWTGPVPDDDVRELIDASYDAAVAALPKSRRPRG
jgi:predicted DNA-binding protein (MmcQ/YjbR family)